MKIFKLIISDLLFLCLLACSGSALDTNSAVEETPLKTNSQNVELILSIDTNGGCMMMGPNCPRYELLSDGNFNVLRKEGGEVANSGKIEMQLIEQWLQVVNKTDFKILLASLGEGECRACFDGVDISYTVFPESKKITISSAEYEFSRSDSFFIVSEMLHNAMRKAGLLEVQSR